MLQNHTSQTQVGQVFAALNPAPRLAIATHLSVNEYSIVPIISAIRSTYPVGPLAIAQDLNVWEISPTNITQRRYANLFLLYTFVVCLSYAEVGHEDLYI